MRFTIDQMVGELRREIRMRERVYPGLVARGKLSTGEKGKKIAILEAIIAALEEYRRLQGEASKQGRMF